MQTATGIERDIRTFIVQNFLSGDASRLTASGSLLGDVIDSMGVLNLVSYLQEHFGINVEDDEVVPSNLDTVDNLVAYVTRKVGATAL